MSHRSFLRLWNREIVPRILLISLVSGLGGCGERPPAVTPEEGERVVQIAEPVAAALLRTLVGRLTSAMETGDVVEAVDLCSNQAIPLTRMVEAEVGGSFHLKRTSFRYRNPDNAPDEAERAALLYFERTIESDGQAPSSYVQRVSDEEFRFYRPLFVGEMCLRCHGDPETMEPEVLRALEQRYPEDLATGYEAGAFRGLVRVSVPSDLLQH